MATARDVAAYILELTGPVTVMKLQKLVYYAQAWSVVWDSRPIFADRVEAWSAGPVVPDLYKAHRGKFEVTRGDIPNGNPEALDFLAKETIEAVVSYYKKYSAQELSQLTHREAPWVDARRGLPIGARSNEEITVAAMEEFYSELAASQV